MYRDDHDALLSRLDSTARECDRLRARNAELERALATSTRPRSATRAEPRATLRSHAPLPCSRSDDRECAWSNPPREVAILISLMVMSWLAGYVLFVGL